MTLMTSEPPMMHRVKDLARRWRVSRQTIHRWIHDGTFPNAIDIGHGRHNWRIPDEDVTAYERRDRSP